MVDDPDLDAQIDRVLEQVVRRIERERRTVGYKGRDSESGITRTEKLLAGVITCRVRSTS